MRTAAAAVMLVAAASAFGAPVPPPSRPDAIASKPTIKARPATRLALGRFQIELERTTLYDVLEAAKVGAIAQRGDAAAAIHYLCLTDADAGRRERLWLVSTPLGGSTRTITKITAELLPEGEKASIDCPQLPPVMRPASLDRGVWVGMTESALRQKLGKPSATNGEWLSFHYAGTTKGKGETVNVLDALARDGKVQALDASHVTSR
jgi:hypothetical protein